MADKGFDTWYAQVAKKHKLNPDPDHPLHYYDWRGAHQSGATADTKGHWPSEFKKPGHPTYHLKYLSQAGEDMTKGFEGWRGRPYLDTQGIPTIGWGFNMNQNPEDFHEDVVAGKRPLTKAEGKSIFEKRYHGAIAEAIKFTGLDQFSKMTEGQRNVIVDMAYQMGGPKFNEFTGMQKAIKEGDYPRAALEMQYSDPDMINRKETPWYQQSGQRSLNNVRQIMGGD